MFAGGRRALLAPQIHAYTKAWIAACTVKPSAKRAALVDRLVRQLVSAGIWAKLDVLYLLAAHDSQAGRLNLVSPGANTCSISGSVTFTADRGFVSDGSTGYLDTNYNPSTGSPKLALNDNSFGLYVNTQVNTPSGGYEMGCSTHALAAFATTNTQFYWRNSTATPNAVNRTGAPGFYALVRTSSANTLAYVDGVSTGFSGGAGSSAIANENFYVCRRNGSTVYCTSRIAALYAGSQLTAAQMVFFNTILRTYLSAIGAA